MSKVVLVAGAEGSLGQAAVRFLKNQGMIVAASCRRQEDLDALHRQLATQELDGVHGFTADLADELAVTSMVTKVEEGLGPLCGVVNAAGGFRSGQVDQLTTADFDFLMSANFRSAWLLAKVLVPRFKKQGYGRLVFVSAKSTLAPSTEGMSLYLASKCAVNKLVESLAEELKGSGVTANAILPSIIDTPANRQAMPDAPWADWVTTDELMQAIWTFLGPEGRAYNGALLSVTGRV
jgi:NAD(P)-dependent dehydrogenase (short-subunit alcohol dehydrogenase family)